VRDEKVWRQLAAELKVGSGSSSILCTGGWGRLLVYGVCHQQQRMCWQAVQGC
jgi:hypothetical protein